MTKMGLKAGEAEGRGEAGARVDMRARPDDSTCGPQRHDDDIIHHLLHRLHLRHRQHHNR